jgi:L-lactate dehydrogenase complex protein LldG
VVDIGAWLVSAAREQILGRIRAATRDVPRSEPDRWDGFRAADGPDAYSRVHTLEGEELIDRFAERVADYRATVVRCAAGDAAIEVALGDALAEHAAHHVVVPHDLPGAWWPDGVDPLVDGPDAPLDLATLDGSDGVITGAALGIAETGTIVLDAGVAQGRRAITLVPDLHLCVVRAVDIVGTVPEAIEALASVPREGRPLTFVSGPSATSDIELNRVEGVHGPRRLVVIIAGSG